ncbi:hypothetical protein [Candidatus Enterovibrio escicola]|uniref:hypothetical protein n=1 Tax=Candidatus Enterovibrio escicola TaxID=1927127 RepID=UPI00168095DA|nr:hypothetical protein [Candidatus Enterovibrio escacola]
MTIVIAFHQSWDRDFKTYYIHFVCLCRSEVNLRNGSSKIPFPIITSCLIP